MFRLGAVSHNQYGVVLDYNCLESCAGFQVLDSDRQDSKVEVENQIRFN